jgi:hypothetical protein
VNRLTGSLLYWNISRTSLSPVLAKELQLRRMLYYMWWKHSAL